LIEQEITVNEVVVDDFTGKDITAGGFSLTRLTDGATAHFQSLTDGAIDSLGSLVGPEVAYRMFVTALEQRLTAELEEELEEDAASALLIAQQADAEADLDSSVYLALAAATEQEAPADKVVERIAEYTVPGIARKLYPVGTSVLICADSDSSWYDGLTGEIAAHRGDGSIFEYDIRLDKDRSTIACFAREVVATSIPG
jgi:hypothetical protein